MGILSRLPGRRHRDRHHVLRCAAPRPGAAGRPARPGHHRGHAPGHQQSRHRALRCGPAARGGRVPLACATGPELGHRARGAARHPAAGAAMPGRVRRAALPRLPSSTCHPRWSTSTCRPRVAGIRVPALRPAPVRSASSVPSWRRRRPPSTHPRWWDELGGGPTGGPRDPGHARQRRPGPTARADHDGPGRRRRAGRGHHRGPDPAPLRADAPGQRAAGALHPPRPAAAPGRRHGDQRRLRRRAAGAGPRRPAGGGRRQRGQARGGGPRPLVGDGHRPTDRPAHAGRSWRAAVRRVLAAAVVPATGRRPAGRDRGQTDAGRHHRRRPGRAGPIRPRVQRFNGDMSA